MPTIPDWAKPNKKKSTIWKVKPIAMAEIFINVVFFLDWILLIKKQNAKRHRVIGWSSCASLWWPTARKLLILFNTYGLSSFGKSNSPKYLWLESWLKFSLSGRNSEKEYSFLSNWTVVIPPEGLREFLCCIVPSIRINFESLFSLKNKPFFAVYVIQAF